MINAAATPTQVQSTAHPLLQKEPLEAELVDKQQLCKRLKLKR